MSDDATTKNIRALHQGMVENRNRINSCNDAATKINNRITMLEQQNTQLSALVHMLLAKSGGGATSGP